MNAFAKFNRSFLEHLPDRGKLLSDLSCFLKWTPDQFVIGSTTNELDSHEFFRHLNELLKIEETNNDFLWAVFQVIQIAIQNNSTRQYLIDRVRIITGIANFAVKSSLYLTEEKQLHVLTLLENITIDINISIEEPFLASLIEYLVASIKGANTPPRIKSLQIFILTNLCFKNEIAIACLSRATKSKELLKHFKDNRVLFCKMAVALVRFDYTMFEFELLTSLKYVFEVNFFTELIRSRDQRLLKHILELLNVGLQRDDHSKLIMEQFDFRESIGEVLTFIEKSRDEIDMSDSQNFQMMDLFMGIVNSILSVANTSLHSNIQRLLKHAIESASPSQVSPEAVKTIRILISKGSGFETTDLIPLITQLIEKIDEYHCNLAVASEIYQLLPIFYTSYPDEFKQIPKNIINNSIDPQKWSFNLTDYNLPMQIYRLQWFLIYTNDDETLQPQLSNVMANKDIHQVLANGIRNSNEEICALTVTLSRFKHFPLHPVSKVLSFASTSKCNLTNPDRCGGRCKSSVVPCFSTSLEKRVNVAVDEAMLRMKDANSYLGSSNHIKLLQYQNIFDGSKKKLLQAQLQAASEMITHQLNEIGGLEHINRMQQNRNNELESVNDNLVKSEAQLKAGYCSLKSKFEETTTKCNESIAKNEELRKERKRLLETKKQLEETIRDKTACNEKYYQEKEELKAKHLAELKIYSSTKDRMKANHDQEIEQMQKRLAEKDKQNEKLSKEIAEKSKNLQEKEKLLNETTEDLKKFKEKADMVKSLYSM